MSNLYIGLMSGTSADGIDAVLVDFQDPKPILLDHSYLPYDVMMRKNILLIMEPGENEIIRMGSLDRELGIAFAEAVNALLTKNNIPANDIRAIGSHGQTIRHYPYAKIPFTLQIGDPNIIATKTGITTIADFRRKDMALNGQGAPLVPRFHQAMFHTPEKTRVIVNIGGIANITILPSDTQHPIIGFDTGPGNALLDAWSMLHLNQPHDDRGKWGATGTINNTLLNTMLQDPYFKLPAPKSSGRDYFQLTWLQKYLDKLTDHMSAADVQATLAELTAKSVIEAIHAQDIHEGELILCGGGIHNHDLLSRFNDNGGSRFTIVSSDALGIHPNLVEAMAFAWLAKQTINRQPGNLPSVTGASRDTVLGGVYLSE